MRDHLEKESMLRKQQEKNEKEKDKAYYMQRIKELHNSKLNGKVLIIGEDDNDDGNVEVRSTDSKDDKVRKPNHRECYT